MSQRRRIFIALLFAVLAFAVTDYGRMMRQGTPRVLDLYVPLCGARSLLAGIDPFGSQCVMAAESDPALTFPLNPMTTILLALPFVPFGNHAESVILGLSSGLLAYGVLRSGPAWRLLIFASGTYWYALLIGQWSILLTAVYLLPALLPLAVVKPHVGLPVILCHLTRRRFAALCAFGLLSLFVLPTWPLTWLRSLGNYPGFIPLAVLPLGPLLLLALWRWRDPAARLFLLMAVVPQKAYDPLCLLLLPQTRKRLLLACVASWLPLSGMLLGWFGMNPAPLVVVAVLYLPVFVMLLRSVSSPAMVRSTTTPRLAASNIARPSSAPVSSGTPVYPR